jgi:hypothetical protein
VGTTADAQTAAGLACHITARLHDKPWGDSVLATARWSRCKRRSDQTIAIKANVVYGAGDAAQAKLAASVGSPVPL